MFVLKAATALRGRDLGRVTHLGRHGATTKLILEFADARCSILKLATALTRGNNNPRWNMAHTHGRIGGINALPSRTGGAKDINLAVTGNLGRRLLRKRSILSICQAFFFHEPQPSTLAPRTTGTHQAQHKTYGHKGSNAHESPTVAVEENVRTSRDIARHGPSRSLAHLAV